MKATPNTSEKPARTVRLTPLAKQIAASLSSRFNISQQAAVERALYEMRDVQTLQLPALDKRSSKHNRRTACQCGQPK